MTTKQTPEMARKWVVTLNNYTDEEVSSIEKIECGIDKPVRNISIQSEIGKDGTKHLQGVVELNRSQRMSYLKKELGSKRYYCDPQKKSDESNISYTTKSETYDTEANIHIIKGVSNITQGKSSKLTKISNNLKEGQTIKEAVEGNAETYIKFHAGIDKYATMVKKLDEDVVNYYSQFEYRGWQQELVELLEDNTAERRKVHWVYEKTGSVGKSVFSSKYLIDNIDTCMLVSEIGKIGDAGDVYRNWRLSGKRLKTLIVDLPRTRESSLSIYTYLEGIKNGFITCTKYSGDTIMTLPANVVVFANWLPQLFTEIVKDNKSKMIETLSMDRWNIMLIKDGKFEKIPTNEIIRKKYKLTPKIQRKYNICDMNNEELDARIDYLAKGETDNLIKYLTENVSDLVHYSKISKLLKEIEYTKEIRRLKEEEELKKDNKPKNNNELTKWDKYFNPK